MSSATDSCTIPRCQPNYGHQITALQAERARLKRITAAIKGERRFP
jgi:hypothetical protein